MPNAIAMVTLLGILLIASAVLLYGAMAGRTRQRDAVRRLLELADNEGRSACDAFTSGFVHDLNNLILVLSLECERIEALAGTTPEGEQRLDILQQVIAEGRDIVERCRSQMALVEASASNLCDELRVAAGLVADAGYANVDVTIASAVPATVTVPRPASDVHLLVLAMLRAVLVEDSLERHPMTVSLGRDSSLSDDINADDWVSVSIVTNKSLSDDDASVTGLTRVARRLSGEVVMPEPRLDRRRLAVSLPVKVRP